MAISKSVLEPLENQAHTAEPVKVAKAERVVPLAPGPPNKPLLKETNLDRSKQSSKRQTITTREASQDKVEGEALMEV